MKWKAFSKAYNKQTKEALILQHQAIQFIAMAGKYLIDGKADDSHSNMIFISDKSMYVGNELPNGKYLALQSTELYLMLVNNNLEIQKQFALEGKSRANIYKMLRKMLFDSGLDITNLKDELHYEIPDHPIAHDGIFSFNDEEGFEENNLYRRNAKIILNEIIRPIKKAGPIRIWPHHFDTACMIPIGYNEQHELNQSIGLGFAIPDSMIDQPYFYLSFWTEEGNENLKNLPALSSGQWMMPQWNGGILSLSEILSSQNNQFELVKGFYQSGIDILQKYFPIH